MSTLSQYARNISQAMIVDRHALRRQLRALQHPSAKGEPPEAKLAAFQQRLRRSIETAEKRRSRLPKFEYDEELPICARRAEIIAAIRQHAVVVICGETGSGKSTQLPKLCLEAERGIFGRIGHTQPRRIAARSVASRLADELGSPLGRDVGYKIRFADTTSDETFVKLMTDGILLAETQGDRFLDQYDTIIIDEAHERSLNIDFLLGMLKRLLGKRHDLKVIITSATIDADRFAQHFRTHRGPAPVIEVSGRTYPIDVLYRPVERDEDGIEPDWQTAVLDAVDEVCRLGPGDVLIFMPTERDIHETAKALRGRMQSGGWDDRQTEILPLYARLPAKEQQRIFRTSAHRRIVIATNVAESSLTVPGIRYVIDPGTARISRYSSRSKTQRLPIEAISQASADQRKGRCGRVGPGTCLRLFSQADFESRDRYTTPEIQRTNLASVILQTKALRLGEIERFPFLDPPKPATIRDGQKTLFELGAVGADGELTEIGRRLSRLPVDPRIGRMILAADDEGCLAEVLIIASVLEIQDPRERPLEKRQAADEAHAQVADSQSDFLGYLKLWDFYHDLRGKLSRSQLRKACRQNFLSYNRMHEWTDIHRQLLQLVEGIGLRRRPRQDEYGPIHRAILTGLLSNVAQAGEAYQYNVGGGAKFHLWPGTGVFETKPRWLVAAEMVETSRRYLRCCGRIDPEWIEPIADHLVKRAYREPRWVRENGCVMALERVTLFGLPIVAGRRVAYGKIDPKSCRELFIQHALVEGEFDTQADFFQHNQTLLAEMEALQAKMRRHDFLLGDWSRYEFYDQRLPDDVYDATTLRQWLEQAERTTPHLLHMSPADIARESVDETTAGQYPDVLPTPGADVPLSYRFEPGSAADGVTVTVPLEGLNQLETARLGWLVPGLLEEKVTAMLRSLPKPIRRHFVPVPDTVKRLMPRLSLSGQPIEVALAGALRELSGQPVSPGDFQIEKIPDELRMNVRVVGTEDQTLSEGRDLDAIREALGAQAAETFSAFRDDRWHRDGLTTWDIGPLPEEVEIERGGMRIKAFPMLVDADESVSLRLSDSLAQAEVQSRRGLMRLFQFAARRDLRSQVAWLPEMDRMLLHAGSLPAFQFKRHVAELIAYRAISGEGPLPRDADAFARQVDEAKRRIPPTVQEVARLLPSLLETHHRARLEVEQLSAEQWQYVASDITAQLDQLTEPGFLVVTPWQWLEQYPRYFRAVGVRLEKLRGGGATRDRGASDELGHFWDRYRRRREEHEAMGVLDPELEQFRWMLEEYRVSLFAQALGTKITVSAKRLDRQWDKVRA